MTETTNIYQKILKDPILSMAFKHIVGKNTSNYAPYHHFHHMICVTKWSMILAEDEDIQEGTTTWYELMLASLFHDMNHSMGKTSDAENVERSAEEYREFHKSKISFRSDVPINGHAVMGIINATQYPYVIDGADLNICQEIIRDADLLVSLEPDWFQNAFLGLMNEMGVEDISKMIAGQKAFHSGIQMRTDAGKILYKTNWQDQCIKTIELLEDLYGND